MVSMVLYFRKGLYADFAINIYYLAIAAYGYAVWTFGSSRKKNKGKETTPYPTCDMACGGRMRRSACSAVGCIIPMATVSHRLYGAGA